MGGEFQLFAQELGNYYYKEMCVLVPCPTPPGWDLGQHGEFWNGSGKEYIIPFYCLIWYSHVLTGFTYYNTHTIVYAL